MAPSYLTPMPPRSAGHWPHAITAAGRVTQPVSVLASESTSTAATTQPRQRRSALPGLVLALKAVACVPAGCASMSPTSSQPQTAPGVQVFNPADAGTSRPVASESLHGGRQVIGQGGPACYWRGTDRIHPNVEVHAELLYKNLYDLAKMTGPARPYRGSVRRPTSTRSPRSTCAPGRRTSACKVVTPVRRDQHRRRTTGPRPTSWPSSRAAGRSPQGSARPCPPPYRCPPRRAHHRRQARTRGPGRAPTCHRG